MYSSNTACSAVSSKKHSEVRSNHKFPWGGPRRARRGKYHPKHTRFTYRLIGTMETHGRKEAKHKITKKEKKRSYAQ